MIKSFADHFCFIFNKTSTRTLNIVPIEKTLLLQLSNIYQRWFHFDYIHWLKYVSSQGKRSRLWTNYFIFFIFKNLNRTVINGYCYYKRKNPYIRKEIYQMFLLSIKSRIFEWKCFNSSYTSLYLIYIKTFRRRQKDRQTLPNCFVCES